MAQVTSILLALLLIAGIACGTSESSTKDLTSTVQARVETIIAQQSSLVTEIVTPTSGPTPTPKVVFVEVTREVVVTATPIPTPTPQTPTLSSRESPVPFGTVVDLGDEWLFKVVSVIPDATDQVLATNPFNDPPNAGNQFFIVKVEATYSGPDSEKFDGRFRLRAVGNSAVAYTTFENSCGVKPDELPDSEVFTGGTIAGNICWEILSSDESSLVMFDEPFFAFGDSSRIFFSLAP